MDQQVGAHAVEGSASTDAPASSEGSSGLTRSLGHRTMLMIGLGSALGTGLFFGSGAAIGVAGPAAVVSYALGALLIAVIGLAMAEMATARPEPGSFGAAAGRYLGEWAGYVSRWCYWAASVIALGGEVVAAGAYLQYWWPQTSLSVFVALVALAIIVINLLSVRAFGRAEVVFSTLKVTALVAFILVALVLVLFGVPGHPATGFAHLTDHGGFMPGGMESIWLSMSIVMFAFVGVEVVPITAAEADDPRRSVRTAMRALVARLGLFYVIAVGLIVTLNAWTDVASAKGLTASPFVKAFDAVGLPAAAGIMNAVILVAALSTGNAQLYGAGRLVHSLAVDRLAPRFLARTTLRGVPLAATLVSTVGLVLAIYLAQTGVADIFTKLASIAIFSVMVTWLLALASFIAFKRRGDVDGSVHLPGGRVTAAIGVVGVLAVMATAFEVDDMRQAALIGSGWVLVLLVAYLLTRAGRARARTY